MICPAPASVAAGGGRRKTRTARRRGLSLGFCAAAGLLLVSAATGQARAADWLDDTGLRGSVSGKSPMRWDGINLGVQMGLSNMNTNFGNGTSSLIAYILRNSTLESEAAPSNWTTLPSTTKNGRQYGAFLGYNMQWDRLVIGWDAAYNRASNLDSSAMDPIHRIVSTSDNVSHDVTLSTQASLKLVDYATLRARAGYTIGQFLPYAVVGAAVGRFNYSRSATVTDIWTPAGGSPTQFGPQTLSDNKDNAIVGGFVVGLGMDVAITPNVFLRGEWEFVGFAPVAGSRASLNTGRVGLGVKF